MGNRFQGKVAVVTGAGRGIGRAVALLLAEEGAAVVANDLGCNVEGAGLSKLPADRVVEAIRSRGGSAVVSYDDVALMEGGEAVIKSAIDTYGHLDALVTSSAVLRDRMIHQMSPLDFDQVVRNNVKGTFMPTKYASIEFRRQRRGRIVHMTSDAGLGDSGRSNYAAASEAIVGFTRTVARDMGKYGVTCNAISSAIQGASMSDESDDYQNAAALALLLCTDVIPNVNGYVFGVNRGNIALYSNPSIQRSVHKWGVFTLDELHALVPKSIGMGL